MSYSETVDWNELIAERETEDIDNDTGIVEEELTPPPQECSSRSSLDVGNSSGDEDILDLCCDDKDIACLEEHDNTIDICTRKFRETTSRPVVSKKTVRKTPLVCDTQTLSCPPYNNNSPVRTFPNDPCNETATTSVHTSRPAETRRRRRRTFRVRSATYQKSPTVGRRSWIARWVRNGFEKLVYDVCNCNETPGVVFAGLCYQQSDVYTMVLKNCNGKRRYWYDKSTERRPLSKGVPISDFERAMRFRANTIGRASTSPGYDLATFVLQNVSTDKRSQEASSSSSLVVVTTDDMLTHPAMYRQMLYNREVKSTTNQRRLIERSTTACRVCGDRAKIVTTDNASVPQFTCWQHAGSYLSVASADGACVCNAVVVDLQFSQVTDNVGSSSDGQYACRLRLVSSGANMSSTYAATNNVNDYHESDLLTIAELVTIPTDSQESNIQTLYRKSNGRQARSIVPIDLEKAHGVGCYDRHLNEEDLFPSMPISNSGSRGIQHYDTAIGRIVDRMHCLVSRFQVAQ